MEERTHQTELGVIHYWVSRAGTGRLWLVLLPGLSADHHLFDKQVEGLGAEYNLLTWDAPAHAASRPFRLAFSLEDMAVYLHGILEAEGVTRPVLVGQSLGGYIAQVYMALYPDAAAGFVSIDSCSMKRKYYTGAELFLLQHTEGMYRALPWKWTLSMGKTGNATTPYGQDLMEKTFSVYGKDEFCALAGHGFRILAQAIGKGGAYDIPCPVLLLCGEKDQAGSGKRYNRAWTKQDGHRLVWIPGAGHCSNADAPELVNGLIREFVQGLQMEENP